MRWFAVAEQLDAKVRAGDTEAALMEVEEAAAMTSLLVVCKFQDLIRRSVPFMSELEVPLLATSHEYDFIAEFRK